MFAIVLIQGKQYKVTPAEVVEVDHLEGQVGETVEFDQVYLLSDGQKTSVGKPTIKGVKVIAKILAQHKGEKIDVKKFKAKVRFRRAKGFRALLTKLEIVSIGKA